MRPLETLLSLANLLAFLVLAVPRLRVVPWMRHLAPIALAIAIAQVLVEGPRWQMVPAYALAVLPDLAAAEHRTGGQTRWTRTDQQVCRRPGCRAGRARAGHLHRSAYNDPRVPLPASKRAV